MSEQERKGEPIDFAAVNETVMRLFAKLSEPEPEDDAEGGTA